MLLQPLLFPKMGLPSSWPWEASFAEAFLRRVAHVRWALGLGLVTYVKLALDFETHAGRALPSTPWHLLQSNMVSLGLRAEIGPRQAEEAPNTPHPALYP